MEGEEKEGRGETNKRVAPSCFFLLHNRIVVGIVAGSIWVHFVMGVKLPPRGAE